MSNSARLHLFWQRWSTPLNTIVKSRSARLKFPNLQEKVNSRDGDHLVYNLSHPLCILNAPQKASSRHRYMHILIDGHFHFNDSADHPCVTHAGANVTLLRPQELENECLKLELVDALHFDVESPQNGIRKGFHPFFHVQRGTSHSDEVIKQVIADAEGRDVEKIEVDQSAKHLIGHPYLRIPTPQLDLFAVLTMVVADCFCNPGVVPTHGGSGSTKAETLFSELLNLLTETTNVVREGDTSRELCARVQEGQFMSAAHWYPEWRIVESPRVSRRLVGLS